MNDYLGSSNQTIHLLTPRYSHDDIQRVPRRELILHQDGTLTSSGIDPLPLAARP